MILDDLSGVAPGLSDQGLAIPYHNAVDVNDVLNLFRPVVHKFCVDHGVLGPFVECVLHYIIRDEAVAFFTSIPELHGIGIDENVIPVPFPFGDPESGAFKVVNIGFIRGYEYWAVRVKVDQDKNLSIKEERRRGHGTTSSSTPLYYRLEDASWQTQAVETPTRRAMALCVSLVLVNRYLMAAVAVRYLMAPILVGR
jgi:hypothetical protein